jgi:hypothetical protein
VRRPGGRPGDHRRVSLAGVREHPGEAPAEHEWLVLEHRVEQPAGGQRQLQRTDARPGGLAAAGPVLALPEWPA